MEGSSAAPHNLLAASDVGGSELSLQCSPASPPPSSLPFPLPSAGCSCKACAVNTGATERDFATEIEAERSGGPGGRVNNGKVALGPPAGGLAHPRLRAPWSSPSRPCEHSPCDEEQVRCSGSLSTGPPAARPLRLPGPRAAGPAPLGCAPVARGGERGWAGPTGSPPTHPWGSHPSLPPADTHTACFWKGSFLLYIRSYALRAPRVA